MSDKTISLVILGLVAIVAVAGLVLLMNNNKANEQVSGEYILGESAFDGDFGEAAIKKKKSSSWWSESDYGEAELARYGTPKRPKK